MSAPIVRAAMRQIDGTLRYLDIDLNNPKVNHPSVLDLAPHPSLKSLDIRDDAYARAKEFRPDYLFLIVKSLVAPTLEHLSMELDVMFYEDLDWATLGKFLSGP